MYHLDVTISFIDESIVIISDNTITSTTHQETMWAPCSIPILWGVICFLPHSIFHWIFYAHSVFHNSPEFNSLLVGEQGSSSRANQPHRAEYRGPRCPWRNRLQHHVQTYYKELKATSAGDVSYIIPQYADTSLIRNMMFPCVHQSLSPPPAYPQITTLNYQHHLLI